MKAAELKVTETGGRSATTRHIPPKHALAVGMPSTPAPKGWQWSALTNLARLESGHTPSRRHPEYWGGVIPWISIGDARAHDGQRIADTEEKTNELGIENSSARVLPANTVCLSRTASVGYVVVTARPMATSQDFVNWVCSKQLDHNFLKYLLIAEDEDLLRFASGSVHQTIYFPEVKAFHICHPPLAEQQRIVGLLDEAFEGLATAKANAEKNLQNARALFESHLQSVFTQRGPGWVEKPLETVASILNGYAFKSTDFSAKEGAKCIKITNVGVREFVSNSDGYLPESFAAEYEKVSVKEGSIVIALTRTIIAGGMKVAVVPEGYDGALLNQRVASIIANEKELNGAFLFAYLSTQMVVDYVKERVNTLMQPNLSITDLRSMPIPAPPRREQNKITEQLDSLREETQRLARLYERKHAALEALKKSLLHQAFTGEL